MEDWNETELRQVCEKAGLPVHPRMDGEKLRLVLLGEESPQEGPLHQLRRNLMAFLLRHWASVRSQLTCPARSGDPNSCFQCTDTRVVACVTAQPEPQQKEILNGRS